MPTSMLASARVWLIGHSRITPAPGREAMCLTAKYEQALQRRRVRDTATGAPSLDGLSRGRLVPDP